MVTKQLADWANRNGYRYINNEEDTFNIIEKRTPEGYTFSLGSEYDQNTGGIVTYLGGVVGSLLFAPFSQKYVVKLAVDDSTWNKGVLKVLSKELKGLANPVYMKGQLSMTMKRNSHNDDTYANMCEAAAITSRCLSANGVKIPSVCVHCQRGECDDFDTGKKTGAYLYPAHSGCARQRIKESLNKMEENKKKERYFPALLVLILGIVVGCIPAAIALVAEFYGSIINLIMYLLIPIIAVPFYRKAHGKAGWGVIPVALILTGIVITALAVAGDYLWVLNEYGGLELNGYFYLIMLDVTYLSGLIVAIVISWIPGLIGVIIAYISLRQKNKKQDASLNRLREQVRMLNLQDSMGYQATV